MCFKSSSSIVHAMPDGETMVVASAGARRVVSFHLMAPYSLIVVQDRRLLSAHPAALRRRA